MRLNHVFLFALSSWIISACSPVALEPDNDHSHKITLSCYFNADSAWLVNVTRSYGINEPAPYWTAFPGLTDATISIFEGDNLITTITKEDQNETQRSLGFYPSANDPMVVPIAGKTYSIQVDHAVLGTVTATCKLPDPVSITRVDKLTDEPDQQGEMLVDIYFQDPAFEENYYELISMYKIVRTLPSGEKQSYYSEAAITTGDPLYKMQSVDVLESSKGAILFSDENMDGNLIKITGTIPYRLLPSSYEVVPDSYQIVLLSLSKEYYQHKTTEAMQQMLSENPFAQPIQVYSNVESGFGIFAGYVKSTYKLP